MKFQSIGWIRSTLRDVAAAPKQGSEGAPDAWLEVDATFAPALAGLKAGDEIVVITWLHLAERNTLGFTRATIRAIR